MLTLFPRIRPNPIPSLPMIPSEPKLADSASEAASIKIEERPEQASAAGAATEMVFATEAPTAEDVRTADVATSVSDSEVFSAFLSGMATGNSEPFVVEIRAQSAAPEPKENLEPSEAGSQDLTEGGPEGAVPITADRSGEEALAPGLPSSDAAVVPSQNPEVISEAIPTQENVGDVSSELIVAGANIFDELDVLHEAAVASSLQDDAVAPSDSAKKLSTPAESQNETVTETAAKQVSQTEIEEEPHVAAAVPAPEWELPAAVRGAVNETPAAIPDESSRVEDLPQEPAPALAPVKSAIERPASEDDSSERTGPQSAAQESEANITQARADEVATVEETPAKTDASPESIFPSVAPSSSEAREEIPSRPFVHSPPSPPKPRRAKGTFFGLARVPEPETMDDSGEVEAYASAAAQAHLDAIDDTFVAHAQLLLQGRERGRVLDIGTGPGQIVIKLGYRLTRWKFVGIDRSASMIEKAIESLATAGELAGRVEFRVADGNALDFPDKSFEMVVCNSVLHHIPDPQKLLSEIARLVKPGGAILLRDLRRPLRFGYAFHVWKHGKHYSGEMRRLFIASVHAAYTEEELRKMLAVSPLRGVRVFRHGKTHIGFERPLAIPAASKK